VASVTTAVRLLGLERSRWRRVGPESLWSAAGLVLVGAGILALTRLGGLVVDAPRAVLRLMLVGVWGWVGLSVAIWLTITATSGSAGPRPGLVHTLAIAGIAHAPVVALGVVVFVSAGVLDLLGPGMVTAWFVFAFWFPAMLVTGAAAGLHRSVPVAAASVAAPYLVWLVVVGRHVLDRIGHLL
jgi:hypothetical protein